MYRILAMLLFLLTATALLVKTEKLAPAQVDHLSSVLPEVDGWPTSAAIVLADWALTLAG